MIPYMVGKLALNSTHVTRGLVKYVPGGGYYRAVLYQNGDKFVTSPPPPPPIVERLAESRERARNLQPSGLESSGAKSGMKPTTKSNVRGTIKHWALRASVGSFRRVVT